MPVNTQLFLLKRHNPKQNERAAKACLQIKVFNSIKAPEWQ